MKVIQIQLTQNEADSVRWQWPAESRNDPTEVEEHGQEQADLFQGRMDVMSLDGTTLTLPESSQEEMENGNDPVGDLLDLLDYANKQDAFDHYSLRHDPTTAKRMANAAVRGAVGAAKKIRAALQ